MKTRVAPQEPPKLVEQGPLAHRLQRVALTPLVPQLQARKQQIPVSQLRRALVALVEQVVVLARASLRPLLQVEQRAQPVNQPQALLVARPVRLANRPLLVRKPVVW